MHYVTFAALIAIPAFLGWLTGFGHRKSEASESFFLSYLAGFGILSSLIFLLALAGRFQPIWIVLGIISIAACLRLCAFPRTAPEDAPRRRRHYLIALAAFILFVTSLATFVKPYEAVIAGEDASIYIASA